jgi:hypothetical protein
LEYCWQGRLRRLVSYSAKAASVAFLLVLSSTASCAAASKEFGIKSFESGTCNTNTCSYKSAEGNPAEAFVQAGGHPPYGLTGYELETELGLTGAAKPIGAAKRSRTDIPAGFATSPVAVPTCPYEKFEKNECPPATDVGEVRIKVSVAGITDTEVGGTVYSLEPPESLLLPLFFGVDVKPAGEPLPGVHLAEQHILLYGHVSDHREPEIEAELSSGDYHEWFELNNLPHEAAIEPYYSELIFTGNRVVGNLPTRGLLQLPSECGGLTNVSHLRLESYEEPGKPSRVVGAFTRPPLAVSFCQNEPFAPLAEVLPGPHDAESGPGPGEPDGAAVAVKLHQNEKASEVDSADVHRLEIQMPEGLTINPSAANGLVPCTEKQFGIAPDPQGGVPITEPGEGVGGSAPISCPASSQIGTFVIETPLLPPGALKGPAFVGVPLSQEASSGNKFRLFLDAESARYSVTVRLIAKVVPNPQTGRLTAYVEAPQQPFSEATLRIEPKAKAVLANPLTCAQRATEATFLPYGEGTPPAIKPPIATSKQPFAASGCPPQPPFSPAQETLVEPSQAGYSSTFTFRLARQDQEPYPSQLTVHLPEGLLAHLGAPAQCSEAQALADSCPPQSQIGTVSAQVGAGSQPLTVPSPSEGPGAVYLTGPLDGAPYGLAFVLPAEHIGPYSFGKIITLATINVNPETTQVTVTTVPQGLPGALPTIVDGVPVRIRQIEVTVNRSGFMVNPTSCSPLSTATLLEGVLSLPPTEPLSSAVSSPLAISGCQNLPFEPLITAHTSAHASRLDGAELSVSVTPKPGNANLKELMVTLPLQLPSRLSTLNQACPQQVFASGPQHCDPASRVGSATVSTPLLSEPLHGTAYLVARGDEFPDLVFLLEGDRLNLDVDGHTRIHDGITSSTFPALPDAPFTTFTSTFPMGRDSLLAANGNLCYQTTYRTEVRLVRKRVRVHRHGRVVRRFVTRRKRVRVALRSPLQLKLGVVAVAQNGRRVEEQVPISVEGCQGAHRSLQRRPGPFRVVGLGLARGRLRMRVYVPEPGRLTVRLGGQTLHAAVRRGGLRLLRFRLQKATLRQRPMLTLVLRYRPAVGPVLTRRARIRLQRRR